MGDYRKDTTDYEPNFIMKDPEDAAKTAPSEAENSAPAAAKTAPAAAENSAPAAADTGGEVKSSSADAPKASRDYEQNVYDFIDLEKTQVFDSVQSFENEQIGRQNASTPEEETKAIGIVPEQKAEPEYKAESTSVYERPAEQAGNQSGHTQPAYNQGFQSSQEKETSYDPYNGGAFRDPREGFGRRPSASANPESGNVYNNFSPADEEIPEYAPSKHKRPKKAKTPSQPVTLTRKSLALLLAGMMVIAVLFGGGSSVLANTLLDSGSKTPAAEVQDTNTSGAYTLEDATESKMSIAQITAKTKDSVVEIRTESVASDSWMQQYVTEGAGSGVIISSDGYIMTNNHVIEGARKITVTTSDEKEYSAKLIGTDSTNDVAVIKIDAEGLAAATYGNSDQINVGDLAVAIGNPLGELGGTVTSGIISALDRELSIDGKTMRLLQTDSSINPGNSGGGLFMTTDSL
ncbi:MAG: trypsin-like peptidase domain-containing protein [Firmicutes bacterium]|nr:trypsin-like peptidase domain-containing protein [Bacillota bacterium]